MPILKKRYPTHPYHVGHIASHSKMFTTCAALHLQEDGAITISDPILKYLPELSHHKDKRFKEITIRDLMNNRSGIFRDGLDSSFWELEKPFLSRQQLLSEVLEKNLVYEPNTQTKYSNIAFSLLGILLENITKTSYQTLIDKLILKKLPSPQIESDYSNNEKFDYADGHSKKIYDQKRKIYKHVPANALASATGFCGNTESTSLFLHELYFGNLLLNKHTRRDLISMSWLVKNATDELYGLGTQFNRIDERTFIGHSGGYPGFVSQTRHCLDTDYVISVIWNSNDSYPLSIVRSITGVLKKVEDNFTKKALSTSIVSEAMHSKWGSSIYIISNNKALHFNLDTWCLHEQAILMEKKKDGLYYSDKIHGYDSAGEPIEFFTAGKTISKVKSGTFTSYNEKDFLIRSQKGIVT